MYLSEKHNVKHNSEFYSECDSLCFKSKNLYNYANYLIKQVFFITTEMKNEGKIEHAIYFNFYDLSKMLAHTKHPDYCSLPSKVSNETLKLLDKNWTSFFSSIKDWKKNPFKYNGMPNPPKYLNSKTGRCITVYDLQAISKVELRDNNIVKLSKTNIKIKTRVQHDSIKQARIIPNGDNYTIEVIYKVKEKDLKIDNHRYASIDIGVNNLACVTSNVDSPFVINGKPLKSINQYYNKEKAKKQSKLEKINHSKKSSKNLRKLTNKRNNKIDNYLHRASRYIINHLVSNEINTLVIGNNKEWKQEINIGKRNNQNFVSIPHSRFIEMLVYKCKLEGINVIIREESYTSKCSFLDNEPICKHEVYCGKRIKRGLFVSREGILINADVNGSLNILRKEFPKIKFNGIEVIAVSPRVVSL